MNTKRFRTVLLCIITHGYHSFLGFKGKQNIVNDLVTSGNSSKVKLGIKFTRLVTFHN